MIPDQGQRGREKAGYRSHPLRGSKPGPLFDVRTYGVLGRNHYAAAYNPPYDGPAPGSVDGLLVRAEILDMLLRVNRRLTRADLTLWLFDAWRPTAVQEYFHGTWMPASLRTRHPDWNDDRIREETLRYWAAPTVDPSSPSPHLTGAAVDLTLCRTDTREQLWMGSVFDDLTAIAAPDHYEDPANVVTTSDGIARDNRRILHWAMVDEGFCPHPEEWWHFSHGDQMWAKLGGHAAAFHGPAQP